MYDIAVSDTKEREPVDISHISHSKVGTRKETTRKDTQKRNTTLIKNKNQLDDNLQEGKTQRKCFFLNLSDDLVNTGRL